MFTQAFMLCVVANMTQGGAKMMKIAFKIKHSVAKKKHSATNTQFGSTGIADIVAYEHEVIFQRLIVRQFWMENNFHLKTFLN